MNQNTQKQFKTKISLDEHRLNHHMVDEVGLLMEYNKDLTIKEAENTIEQNKQKREKLSILDQVLKQSEETPGLQGGLQQGTNRPDNTES